MPLHPEEPADGVRLDRFHDAVFRPGHDPQAGAGAVDRLMVQGVDRHVDGSHHRRQDTVGLDRDTWSNSDGRS